MSALVATAAEACTVPVFRYALDRWEADAYRLVVPEGEREPRRCQSCDVAEACLRGDSAARARLLAWRAQVSSRPSDAAQRALLDLWPLGGDRA